MNCAWCYEVGLLQLECLTPICDLCFNDLLQQSTFSCLPECPYEHSSVPMLVETPGNIIDQSWKDKIISEFISELLDLTATLSEQRELYQSLFLPDDLNPKLKAIALTAETLLFIEAKLAQVKASSHIDPNILDCFPLPTLPNDDFIEIKNYELANNRTAGAILFPYQAGVIFLTGSRLVYFTPLNNEFFADYEGFVVGYSNIGWIYVQNRVDKNYHS